LGEKNEILIKQKNNKVKKKIKETNLGFFASSMTLSFSSPHFLTFVHRPASWNYLRTPTFLELHTRPHCFPPLISSLSLLTTRSLWTIVASSCRWKWFNYAGSTIVSNNYLAKKNDTLNPKYFKNSNFLLNSFLQMRRTSLKDILVNWVVWHL